MKYRNVLDIALWGCSDLSGDHTTL